MFQKYLEKVLGVVSWYDEGANITQQAVIFAGGSKLGLLDS